MSVSNGGAPGPEASALQRGIFLPYGDPKVSGKALAVEARVRTPSGWKLNGDMAVGDEVIDPDGGVGCVEGVFPQGVRAVYRVQMTDGGSVLADGNHLWLLHGRYERAVTTTSMRMRLELGHEIALPSMDRGPRRRVHAVTPVGHTECQCIAVSTKRNLYVTDDDIVTHNTTMLVRAFPRALIIGRRDAIQPIIEGGCGFTPAPWQIIETITTLPHLVHFLSVELKSKEWQAALRAHGITAVVVDDLSQLATKSVLIWRAEKPDNKFWAFNMLDQYLDTASYQIADLGMLAGLSAHMTEPKWDTNEKSPTYGKRIAIGAPEMPSKGQTQAVPGWATLVAPVRNGTSLDPWWPKVLVVDPAVDSWVNGDRNSVCWAETPANLREILRAARTHYDLPRLAGLEWQDDTAETVALAIDAGEPVLDVCKRIVTYYREKNYALPGTPSERHVQWAVQDGIARHTIRARRNLGVLAALLAAAPAAPPPPPPAQAGTAGNGAAASNPKG